MLKKKKKLFKFSTSKPVLFLDCDGVICDSVRAICSLYNEDFQYYKHFKPVQPEYVDTWDFEECTCARPEYINSYFNQKRFFDRLQFFPYAKWAIKCLSAKYDIKVVSMGYSPNLIGKCLWIHKNLPDVEFIGINYKEFYDKSHVDMKNAIFIDDAEKNLATSNARSRYCFGEVHSWNKNWKGKRLLDWSDVVTELLGL